MSSLPEQSTELKKGESREVCRLMLPLQAGKTGECVRFTLLPTRTTKSSREISSKPFLIGRDPQKTSGQCS